jgi:chemotaxis protein MotA
MDIASIIGIVVGIGALAFGYRLEGGNFAALMSTSAIIIIFGGTLGTTCLSYGLNNMLRMPVLFMQLFKAPKSKIPATIETVVKFSESARKDGLLSLEKLLETESASKNIDPLLRHGIIMVVDGTDLNEIKNTLETEIYVQEQNARIDASMFETAAGFSPTMGVIGTVMGLVQVLSNMESPEKLAASVAVAFIATLFGVGFANLILMPAANKLKLRLKYYKFEKELIIEGICSIRNGENPKLIREKLNAYLLLSGSKVGKAEKETKNRRGK